MVDQDQIKVINNTLADMVRFFLNDMPGATRDANAASGINFHDQLRTKVLSAYKDAELTRQEQAQALNNLAYSMVRLGYGEEAVMLALESMEHDDAKIQTAGNYGVMAYATGLIRGDYEGGLRFYDKADDHARDNGKFNATALIKANQNRGQIYHRMGMQDPAHYTRAIQYFEEGLDVLGQADLDERSALQFRGQLGYCYAKTLTHKARIDPEHAGEILALASEHVENGMTFINSLQGFDFERACFVAVKGDLLIASGNMEEGMDILADAWVKQREFGPTLVPRFVSTMIKGRRAKHLLDPSYPETSKVVMNMLQQFYGKAGHPDMAAYQRAIQAPVVAPRANGPK